jgi:SAM-dependent methyltransferase
MPQSNFEAARQFAEFGLLEKVAGRRESASGPGSSHDATREAIAFTKRILSEYQLSSIIDLGCGDWNWMKYVPLSGFPDGSRISYEGWDASEQLVSYLNATYGNEHTLFRTKDITTEPLPRADLVIARDVLFHLDLGVAARLVSQIRQTARFFLSTSFPEMKRNGNIENICLSRIGVITRST